jgi:VanZ family protein
MKNFEGEMPDGQFTDKYVHLTFYFIFTVLWYLTFRLRYIVSGAKIRLTIFLIAVVFGILIELAQEFFTTDRSADVNDALANSTGSALAVLVLWLIPKLKK